MKLQITNLRSLSYLVTAVILLVGLGGSVLIYLAADKHPDNALGYDVVGGDVYPIMPEDSKMYKHDLELFGGKANVIANDFTRWFAGLWQGESLAYTVACLTIIVSLGFFLIANHLTSGSGSDTTDRKNGME